MKTKIIPFYGRHFKRLKYPPLTSKMIVALLAACDKQRQGIAYGPHDIKGSFTALITRGLIVRKPIGGTKELQWQVTFTAIEMLRNLGLDVSL